MIRKTLERCFGFLGAPGTLQHVTDGNPGTINTELQCGVLNVTSVFISDPSDLVGNLISLGRDRPPELELKNAKGLSNENLQNLQSELTKLAEVRCGEVRVHTHTHTQRNAH